MATQLILPVPGLNATPGTLARIHKVERRLTRRWDGFNAHFARILGELEGAESASLHLVRAGNQENGSTTTASELTFSSKVVRIELTDEQKARGILPYKVVSAEDDRNRLSDAGLLHPAIALRDNMSFIFSDGRTAFRFTTDEEDYTPRIFELITPSTTQQILLPLYTEVEGETSEKLGVLSFEGNNLFWKDSTCVTEAERILEIMLVMSLLSTGISAKLEAGTDALTKLMRKKEFKTELNRALRAVREGRIPDISIVMVDIDYFKRINDKHGHLVGDTVLGIVADVLMNGVRNEQRIARKEGRAIIKENPVFDVVARYGGEEFAIIAITEIDGAIKMADRLRMAVERACSEIENNVDEVTCSFGVASLSQCIEKVTDIGAETWRLLMERADQMLYQAKRNGRNRVEPQPASTDWAL
ncbi:TPA: GGDEF domain-containing protein [Candidatus Micrarchaeota archaeon]|nr:GGDEF domain-containing protein [Candidatus Micrarchaeota archaeon]